MLNNTLQVSGHFKLQRIKADTGQLVQEIEFDNLITDIGLDRLGTGVACQYCYVSSSTAAPSVLDTSMAGLVANTSTVQLTSTNNNANSPYWRQQSKTFRFAAGAAAGNLTKVGIGWSTASTNALWSSALIVDVNGNPVSITVLADEFLDVTYTLRYYPPLTDSTYTVTISGTAHTVTSRVRNVTSLVCDMQYSMSGAGSGSVRAYNGPATLGPVTGDILNSTTSASALSASSDGAYVSGSLKRSFTVKAGLNDANLANGITAIAFESNYSAIMTIGTQCVISPSIMKTADKTLSISIETSWGRYTP